MTEYEITHGLSQDAPGPLEPVSTPTSHPIPTGATREAVKRLRDAIEGECGGNWISEKQAAAVLAHLGISAPAAGDALDKARLDWLEQHDGRFYNKDRISSIVDVGFLVAGDLIGMRHQSVRAAIDAAIAQQKGEA